MKSCVLLAHIHGVFPYIASHPVHYFPLALSAAAARQNQVSEITTPSRGHKLRPNSREEEEEGG